MVVKAFLVRNSDHCRIGSLENISEIIECIQLDHCRIGSLETTQVFRSSQYRDHCRIGSLENIKKE